MQVDNRKPFDLQQALAGKPVEFRGKYISCKIIKILRVPELAVRPVLLITSDNGIFRREADGRYSNGSLSDSDLVMSAPKMVTKTAWAVKYKGQLLSPVYSTEADAASAWNKWPRNARLYKTVTVTWQEEEES